MHNEAVVAPNRVFLTTLVRDLEQNARLQWNAAAKFRQLRAETAYDGLGPLADVVLAPGIWQPRYFLEPLAREIREAGYAVHSVPHLKLGVPRIEVLAHRMRAFLEENELADVVIVGYSKGGLLGKQLLLDPRVRDRIRGVIAIATPWHGTVWGEVFPPGLGVRDLRPQADMINNLGSHGRVNQKIVSVYPHSDTHVSLGSFLSGAAANIELEESGHYAVLESPELVEVVLETLAQWRSSGQCGSGQSSVASARSQGDGHEPTLSPGAEHLDQASYSGG